MNRGFCAIGIWHAKTEENIGSLIRSARILGANFAFTIGRRYRRQSSECKLGRHLPVLHFSDFDDWRASMPPNARLVAVEMHKRAHRIETFIHPEQAIYLLGAEDHGLSEHMMQGCQIVQIPGERSLNVAVAGSIVLYDRLVKTSQKAQVFGGRR